jgi:hypothetical protein
VFPPPAPPPTLDLGVSSERDRQEQLEVARKNTEVCQRRLTCVCLCVLVHGPEDRCRLVSLSHAAAGDIRMYIYIHMCVYMWGIVLATICWAASAPAYRDCVTVCY